jgi:phosphatidate cytidylyltransferase
MNLEHKTRIISAVLGVALLLGIYFGLGHHGVVLITVAIAAIAYFEFLSFSGARRASLFLSAAAGIALCAWLSLGLPYELVAIYLASLAILLRGLWRAHAGGSDQLASEFQFTQTRVFGLIYLVVFPSFVPKVHALHHGPLLLLLLLGIIWLGDIGGYYGGRMLGKNKLAPVISPGKTREGALTALLVCAIWAGAFGHFILPHRQVWKWILLGLSTSVVAQAGDLIESLMKRAYNVKDSGSLIPGHGGVFDRFDSLILAAPFFYWLLRLFA